jgi:hypothetical protein
MFEGVMANPVKVWKLGIMEGKLHCIILESKGVGKDMWLILWSKSPNSEERQYKIFYVFVSPSGWPDLSQSIERWEWCANTNNNRFGLRGGTDLNDETRYVWEIVTFISLHQEEQDVTFSGTSPKRENCVTYSLLCSR